jgi:hypothetical protein
VKNQVVDAVQPIAELFRGDCVALWSTTYNVELDLYNEYLLRRLGDAPINAVVLADRRRLDESLGAIPPERLDTLGPVNRRWLLRGVQIEAGRFHRSRTSQSVPGASPSWLAPATCPRMESTLDEKYSPHSLLGRPLALRPLPPGEAGCDGWSRRAATRFWRAASLISRNAFRRRPSPWPTARCGTTSNGLSGPGFCDSVRAVAGSQIDELIVAAPYFDEEGAALGALLDQLRPKSLRLYTTSSTSVAGPALASRLASAACEVEVLTYEPDRFTHAKLIGAIAGNQGWLLSGSANLSRAALTLEPKFANVELGVFAELTADQVRGAFLPPGIDAVPQPLESLEDLTYDSGTVDQVVPQIRLTRATLIHEGRVHVASEPEPTPGCLLASHHDRVGLTGMTTTRAFSGPLVRLESPEGEALSNWVVIEDPAALSNALEASRSGGAEQPGELTRRRSRQSAWTCSSLHSPKSCYGRLGDSDCRDWARWGGH